MDHLIWAEELMYDNLLPNCQEFHYFPQLPAEIQDEIWSQTLPRRILRVTLREREESYIGPPPTAHVCSRARYVALQTGGMRAIVRPPSLKCTASYEELEDITLEEDNREEEVEEYEYTWFDTARDALILDRLNILAQPEELKALAERVIYAGFRCEDMSIWYMDSFISREQWPRLKSIEVILNGYPNCIVSDDVPTSYIVRPNDVPALLKSMGVLPYWGSDFGLFEDERLLQCFMGYSQSFSSSTSDMENLMVAFKGLHVAADGVPCKCRMRSWKKFKNDVACMWLWFRNYSAILDRVDRGERLLSAPVNELKNLGWTEKLNHGHPWVKQQLKELEDSTPKIRPVFRWTPGVDYRKGHVKA